MPRLFFSILKIFIISVLLAVLILWYILIGPQLDKPGSHFNKNKNGIWLEHAWLDQQKSEDEIKNLVNSFKKNKIRYVYVHAGPVSPDGSLDADKYPYAEYFLNTARKYDTEKDILYLAWLGQLRNRLFYQNPSVRENFKFLSQFLSFNVGFDGIHLNIEPIPDNDEAYLLLIQDIKNGITENKILSVASDEWQPKILTKIAERIFNKDSVSYWSSKYFSKVAEITDQIVIMTYDTGLKRPFSYEWLVSQQVIYLSKSIKESEILIGIPTYEIENESFYPAAENINSGINGVLMGLNNIRSRKSNFAGISIYSNWETEEDEWEIYRNLWLK